jgi:hypothetical protein
VATAFLSNPETNLSGARTRSPLELIDSENKPDSTVKENAQRQNYNNIGTGYQTQRNIYPTRLVYWLLVSLALALTSPVGHPVQDVKWNQSHVYASHYLSGPRTSGHSVPISTDLINNTTGRVHRISNTLCDF